ncbi:MAG: GGDEF domain-containing phosphodiesterase [Candidatus Competibacteraceae bacterium]
MERGLGIGEDYRRTTRALRGGRAQLVLGVSVGVSLSDGENASVLIRNADTAMYRAKERGGNIVHFYTPALTKAVQQRVSISALRRAMDANELELYFQPIMEIDSRRIVGTEALLHWRAPGKGVLLPESFLPIAELSGLIVQVGRHVIDLACAHLAGWRTQSLRVPRLSINVSARQCMDEAFWSS